MLDILDYSVLLIGASVLVYRSHKMLYEKGIIGPFVKRNVDFNDSFYLKQIQRKYLKGNAEFIGRGIKLGNEISYVTIDKNGTSVRIFKEND